MSKYTTGEIAKLCGVSVRTVQYYDSRNILIPSELSEGGRRLYSEQDLKRMKIICFLRDAGISINSIGELLSEDNPGSVISVLLEQQEQLLQEEVSERKAKLEMIDGIRRELKSMENFSVESIGDIAYALENKKKMNQLHAILLISGIPIGIIQWTSIIMWIATGIWWPIIVWALLAIPYNKLFIAKPDGSPQRRDRMSANFGQLIRHLEMPHIRFHDLRHTAATNMHQLTGDFYTVGEILGHTLKGIGISLGISTNLEVVTAQYVDVRLERKQRVLQTYHKALQPKTTVTGKEAGQETSKKAKKKSSEMEL